MEPAPASAAEPLPTTADLERVMGILGIPGDPVYIMKDHPDARRRADLLAHVAAGTIARLGPAETGADLDVDERVDLHWEADRDIAATWPGSLRAARLLDLQIARLSWVQHAVLRERGRRPDPVADTVVTTVGAIAQLLESRRDTRPTRWGTHPDPMLADALVMVRDAAAHLAGVLRTAPPAARVPDTDG
jgi:hypothetical protein